MTEPMKILVVDDKSDIRTTLHEILTDEGYDVIGAGTIAEATIALERGIDLALVDIKIGDENGIDLLQSIRSKTPHIPVVMITGHGSVSLASQAFKLGAHDFLEKPLRLMQIRTCIRNALEGLTLKRQLAMQKAGGAPEPIYHSACMADLFAQAARLSRVREPVIVCGPSGSGKELLARSLHFSGNRAEGPFIATNAASMPLTLAEDELFGHEKGAFTGAEKIRQGCFEQAHGGTLFLDEIGELDLQVQAKLLRVLENGLVQRLGGSKPLSVDVRIVCATHRNLPEMVERGAFRNDLWYRISAFVMTIPGLNKRKNDIPPLAISFLSKVSAELGVPRSFSDDALEALMQKEYPGNVRELKHLVTRLAVFCDQPIIDGSAVCRIVNSQEQLATQPHLRVDPNGSESGDYRLARETFEKKFFQQALEKAHGNITAAAQGIGMAQSNFSRKIKQLGLR